MDGIPSLLRTMLANHTLELTQHRRPENWSDALLGSTNHSHWVASCDLYGGAR